MSTPPTFLIEPWSECDPAEAARRLQGCRRLVWLDSALAQPGTGRWSIVACDPRWTMAARGSQLAIEDAGAVQRRHGDPLALFAAAVEEEQRGLPTSARDLKGLPFAGGAIGYIGFELGRYVERLPATTADDIGVPDLAMAWYDAALVWDGHAGAGWLAGTPDAVGALRERLLASSTAPADACEASPRGCSPVANMTRSEYLAAVARAREYIAAGDIYQVNLSQRFSVPVHVAGLDLYTRLRKLSPAPFAAYLDFRDLPAGTGVEILSSSPERLLLVDGDELETRPIKGTRPRGTTPAADRREAEALLASAKDAAEHIMIVDLERNDLGRVAEVGSVRVEALAALETYAQVHHLTSTIVARRRPQFGLEATLRAIFPGGSVTGAPKIRALEIIDELEPTVRGVYTGAIGYLSADGRSDLNVAIRPITLAAGAAHFHVGGAIVADSTPAAEYQETLDKARGMARALGVNLPDEVEPAEVEPRDADTETGAR